MGCRRMLSVEDRAAIMAGGNVGLSKTRIAHLIGCNVGGVNGCSTGKVARNSIETASIFEIRTLKFSAFWGLANLWCRGITCEIVG